MDQVEFVVQQYRTRYWDFTLKPFHEALHAECGWRRSARRIGKRSRRPLPAMMLFWSLPCEGRGRLAARLAGGASRSSILSSHWTTATSVIYSAFLVEEDGTASSFRGLSEVIAAKGLFASLYTDPGSRYFLTSTTAERNRFPLSRNNASRGCGRAFSTATPHFRNLLNRRTVILYR